MNYDLVELRCIERIRSIYSDKIWLPPPEDMKAKDAVAADCIRDMAPAIASIMADIMKELDEFDGT